MKRNLNSRVETVLPILDEQVKMELREILDVYVEDNCSAWDCLTDGTYERRSPASGEVPLAAQEVFIRMSKIESGKLGFWRLRRDKSSRSRATRKRAVRPSRPQDNERDDGASPSAERLPFVG